MAMAVMLMDDQFGGRRERLSRLDRVAVSGVLIVVARIRRLAVGCSNFGLICWRRDDE
jgi:hypothetical protein